MNTLIGANPFVVNHPAQETAKQKCEKGCNEKKDECMKNAPAADDENSKARRNACFEAWTECLKSCEQ